MLKNSGSVIAMVAYCGRDTKLILNQGKSTHKVSKQEKYLNIFLIFNILMIFTLAGIFAGCLYHFILDHGIGMQYVYYKYSTKNIFDKAYADASKVFATFLIMYNKLVPLTLLVTLDLGRLAYSSLIEHDAEMMVADIDDQHGPHIQKASINNTNLLEQLG